jgi:surface polysaccharide O-acyltransferase-like enzyme
LQIDPRKKIFISFLTQQKATPSISIVAATKMTRHAGFDNCKNVFIFFVVLIHLCNYDLIKWSETNAGWSPTMDNFMESYTRWHEKLSVPGFVFLSGFFGKGFLHTAEAGKKADKRWEKTVSVLLVGAALVQAVDFGVGYVGAGLVTGEWNKPPLWFPLWEKLETWYLIALFLWRLSTPLISRLRYPILSSFLVTFVCLHIQFEGPMDMR